ncbi:TadA family conjugal transfer-associated ATPase [Naumannella halotolerans]|uniref:Pilus assembly protein CpaF n=1 Tax=Naumannella halotolerans TaxID=993414 RepID=A0A4R7J0J9_9ACTN|nr:TadA family conjugal transfer-associated ATPase [Naumannella halotolerans]TDT29896.1 pilus assembly protein CpaF [Naumannella halotolerans]
MSTVDRRGYPATTVLGGVGSGRDRESTDPTRAEVDLDRLRPWLAELEQAPTPADVAQAMRAAGFAVTDRLLAETVGRLRRDITGAGPLEDLLHQPGVTDVLVNGPDQVFVDRGRGLEPAGISFANDAEVRRLASRLSALAGRRLDDSAPFVDARMADGVRVHAILSSLADPGTCLSLRVPRRTVLDLAEWVRLGSLHPVAAELFDALINCRAAFLISGGTGTGKTTLLASLLSRVPDDERILIVEDSRELNPDHGHCLRLEARPANAEGAGRISLTDLVRQALRMRPDRLVLGEVRGAEVADLLTAMNTGHEGGCGTVHANSASDVPARLEALAALGGMGRDAVHSQLAAAVDVFIHLSRGRDGLRSLSEICVATRSAGEVRAETAVRFDHDQVQRCSGAERLDRILSR